MRRDGWLWYTFSEPLTRGDAVALFGFVCGVLGGWLGAPRFLSLIGALAGGMCLGQLVRDRQQRAHERRMKQQQAEHEAKMAEILTMDFKTLLTLSGADAPPHRLDAPPHRRCPRCERVTFNPNDIKESYCGACHDWT